MPNTNPSALVHPLRYVSPINSPRSSCRNSMASTYVKYASEQLPSPLPLSEKNLESLTTLDEPVKGTASVSRAVFLLIKAFVGAGLLFLPRAFEEGGLAFTTGVMLATALLSWYAYLLLIKARETIKGPASFGDIAMQLYGWKMQWTVQASIALSQYGFVCAYMIFIASTLSSFVENVSNCRLSYPLYVFIFIQAAVFIPLAMIRRIEKLGFTAIVAEVFIVFGVICIFYYDANSIAQVGFSSTVKMFNPDKFALMIGKAVYAFEGVGLVIPITESMKEPKKFPRVLWITLLAISILFISVGTLSYGAFGESTQSVILFNFPQQDALVNTVQFLYAIAIMLSVPLQLFPAMTITENGLFGLNRSGATSWRFKWSKNAFRLVLVLVCAVIAYLGANNLNKFVSLIGAFACIPLCFIYPAMFHLKIGGPGKWSRAKDWALIVVGVAVMAYSTWITIDEWIHNVGQEVGACAHMPTS